MPRLPPLLPPPRRCSAASGAGSAKRPRSEDDAHDFVLVLFVDDGDGSPEDDSMTVSWPMLMMMRRRAMSSIFATLSVVELGSVNCGQHQACSGTSCPCSTLCSRGGRRPPVHAPMLTTENRQHEACARAAPTPTPQRSSLEFPLEPRARAAALRRVRATPCVSPDSAPASSAVCTARDNRLERICFCFEPFHFGKKNLFILAKRSDKCRRVAPNLNYEIPQKYR